MGNVKVPDLNLVMGAGRMCWEPELKRTTEGSPYMNLSVAVDRHYRDRNGESKKDTTFIKGTLWGPSAEYAEKSLKKGAAILYEGSLTNREKQVEGGKPETTLEVRFLRVSPLEWPDDGQG